jgi:hypothetical protein
MPNLFLAYAYPDREFAARVKSALDQKGFEVWDWFAGLPDSAWGRIFPAIDSSVAFVFIITNQAVVSRACLQELDYAVQQDKRIFLLHREEVPTEGPIRSLRPQARW